MKLGYRIEEVLPVIRISGRCPEYVKLVKEISMLKKCLSLIVFMSLISCCSSFAQDAAADAESQFKAVRQKKYEVTRNYNEKLWKVNASSEKKLSDIKKEFHARRDECLRERSAEQKKLTDEYMLEIIPLTKEEEKLIELMNPGRGMNFAKPKAERKK